jgi:hypothetical protein
MAGTSRCWDNLMSGILQLHRHKTRLHRELLRRIGYTNGLHDVFRFARVVEYLYPMIPTSVSVLKSKIAECENRTQSRPKKLSPNKYVEGIIDVSRALALIDKAGERLLLSDRGYALHALQRPDGDREAPGAFLLMSILEADGEYILNLLDLIGEDTHSPVELGHRLMGRILRLIGIKEEWAGRAVRSRAAAAAIRSELAEARRVLEDALDPQRKSASRSRAMTDGHTLEPKERVSRFLEHTVVPRREWLVDLGCVTANRASQHLLTEKGSRLLRFFGDAGCREEADNGSLYQLPLSSLLCEALDCEQPASQHDIFWKAVAVATSGVSRELTLSGRVLLDRIKALYKDVKLYGFNEAETSAIFHVLSCQAAINGRYLAESNFEEILTELSKDFPQEIFQLSKRRGAGGYIALRDPGKGTSVQYEL